MYDTIPQCKCKNKRNAPARVYVCVNKSVPWVGSYELSSRRSRAERDDAFQAGDIALQVREPPQFTITRHEGVSNEGLNQV